MRSAVRCECGRWTAGRTWRRWTRSPPGRRTPYAYRIRHRRICVRSWPRNWPRAEHIYALSRPPTGTMIGDPPTAGTASTRSTICGEAVHGYIDLLDAIYALPPDRHDQELAPLEEFR